LGFGLPDGGLSIPLDAGAEEDAFAGAADLDAAGFGTLDAAFSAAVARLSAIFCESLPALPSSPAGAVSRFPSAHSSA